MKTSLLAAALLTTLAAPAFAQVTYNRRITADDVTFEQAPTPGEVMITVRSRVASQVMTVTNLSCVIRITANGVILADIPQYTIIGGGQTCNGSCPTGDCSIMGSGSTCSDFSGLGGQGCACDVVVTPNSNTYWARIMPGDVIGVTLEPMPGAVAERFTADDAITVTYGSACDPDMNKDGNVDQDDLFYLINVIGGGENLTGIDPDFNHDGNADQDDVLSLIDVIAGGGCP